MFNVGGPEIVVILLVALVVLGPEQLPKAMRTFGNVMAEIRKVSGGFQAEMRKAMDSMDDSSTAKPATPAPRATAVTMEEADVTEVVARNPDLGSTSTSTSPEAANPSVDEPTGSDGPAVEVDPGRPTIDPADRAAG